MDFKKMVVFDPVALQSITLPPKVIISGDVRNVIKLRRELARQLHKTKRPSQALWLRYKALWRRYISAVSRLKKPIHIDVGGPAATSRPIAATTGTSPMTPNMAAGFSRLR